MHDFIAMRECCQHLFDRLVDCAELAENAEHQEFVLSA